MRFSVKNLAEQKLQGHAEALTEITDRDQLVIYPPGSTGHQLTRSGPGLDP